MSRSSSPQGAAIKRNVALSSQVHGDLLGRIQRGEIRPDHRLVDIGIAQEMGISRMPVREALLRLANDGYVTSTTRGFMLTPLAYRDMIDIFEVRRLLEPRAAANAARELTVENHATLNQALEETRAAIEAGDVARLTRANVAFRQIWTGALTNKRLAETISRFGDQVQSVRVATLDDPSVQRIVLNGMVQLYEAFLARDAMAASDAMNDYLAIAQQIYGDGFRRHNNVAGNQN